MKKIIVCVLCFLLVAPPLYAQRKEIEYVPYSGVEYEKKDKNAPIDLFYEDEQPTKKYKVLGKFIGFCNDGEDVNPTLRKRAREVGGDAVVNIELTSRKANSAGGDLATALIMSKRAKGVQVEAKVIKYIE